MYRLCIPDPPPTRNIPTSHLFSHSRPTNQKHRLGRGLTDSLRNHVTQLQLLVAEQNVCQATGQPIGDDLVERLFVVASDSVRMIHKECRDHIYSRHNRKSKNMFYHYDTDELNACRRQILSSESVYMDGEMFDGEMLSAARRVFGCLAGVCRSSAKFCEALAARRFQTEQLTCLELLAEALMNVGYSVRRFSL